MPFSNESLKRTIEKIVQAQDFLGQKIYLENPLAYLDFKFNDFSEADFVNELCQKSGCGLLLDLNNLIVNKYNLGLDPINYLEKIKNCDVLQFHLAGHTIKNDVRIDTHDSDISQEVLDLIPQALSLWPEANPMIEWDDKIPSLTYLLNEQKKIQPYLDKPIKKFNSQKNQMTAKNHLDQKLDSIKHESFWNLLKKEDFIAANDISNLNLFETDRPTPALIGINVYSSAYYNRQIEVLTKDFPVLSKMLDELFSDVTMAYIKTYPSKYDCIDYIGQNFGKFILESNFEYSLGVDQKIISDIAYFEYLQGISAVAAEDSSQNLEMTLWTENDWLQKNIKLKRHVKINKFNSDIYPVIKAVVNETTPEIPELNECFYLFYREQKKNYTLPLTRTDYLFLENFLSWKNFASTYSENAEALQTSVKQLAEFQHLFNQS